MKRFTWTNPIPSEWIQKSQHSSAISPTWVLLRELQWQYMGLRVLAKSPSSSYSTKITNKSSRVFLSEQNGVILTLFQPKSIPLFLSSPVEKRTAINLLTSPRKSIFQSKMWVWPLNQNPHLNSYECLWMSMASGIISLSGPLSANTFFLWSFHLSRPKILRELLSTELFLKCSFFKWERSPKKNLSPFMAQSLKPGEVQLGKIQTAKTHEFSQVEMGTVSSTQHQIFSRKLQK